MSRSGLSHEFRQRWVLQGVLLTVILFGAWLRLWHLPELPPGLWWDEAYNGMDAIWMADTGSPQLFLTGNKGREPLPHYFGAFVLTMLGTLPYTFRIAATPTGILTIPLVYRWLVTFFYNDPDRLWFALLAMAGLAVSFWHVSMSRSGYRAIWVPLFFIVTAHLFWVGWRRQSISYYMLAGVTLG